jgi:glutamate dehydrogenase (NAD(P)+)
MAWMMDTYSMHLGYTVAGVVAGKPLGVGGTAGRREATSRGALRATLAAAKRHGIKLDGATVAVQGFGRVGSTLAEMLQAVGMRIVAIADDHDAVLNPRGIDVGTAVHFMREHDAIQGLPEAEPIDRTALFDTECALLVSAGVQDQIDGPVAERIRASIVVEAANGPTTPEGEQVLADRGIPVLPDILCTAGGMVLSYFEWVQDMQSFFWTDAEISENLDRIIDDATDGVFAMAEEQKVDLRSAAMMLAVGRVADATNLRGLYP